MTRVSRWSYFVSGFAFAIVNIMSNSEAVTLAQSWLTTLPTGVRLSPETETLPFVVVSKRKVEAVSLLDKLAFSSISCDKLEDYADGPFPAEHSSGEAKCFLMRGVDVQSTSSLRYVFRKENELIVASFWLGDSDYELVPSPVIVVTTFLPTRLFVHFSAAK